MSLGQIIDRELNLLYDDLGDQYISLEEYWAAFVRIVSAYKKLRHIVPVTIQNDLDVKMTHCYLTYLGMKCYHPITVDQLLVLTKAENVCKN